MAKIALWLWLIPSLNVRISSIPSQPFPQSVPPDYTSNMCGNTMAYLRKSFPIVEMVVTVSMKCERLVTESTTTIMQSLPFAFGSSDIKSTLITSQGLSGTGRGWSSPIGGWRGAFVRKHISQVETYFPMYRDICGHQ